MPTNVHCAGAFLPISISNKYSKAQFTRWEQTLFNRFRIGRTYLTHSYYRMKIPHYVYIVILY